MGRKSYLGGSTVIHDGSGWFGRDKRLSAHDARTLAALTELYEQQQGLQADLRSVALAEAAVAMAHQRSAARPRISVSDLPDIGNFQQELRGILLPLPSGPGHRTFDAARLRQDATYAFFVGFSIWAITAPFVGQAIGVSVQRPDASRVFGFYPALDDFKRDGARNGWLVTSGLGAAITDEELARVWKCRGSAAAGSRWASLAAGSGRRKRG